MKTFVITALLTIVSVAANAAIASTDMTAPTVTGFSVPSIVKSTIIPVTEFSASDDVGVTGYMISLTSTPPKASTIGWRSAKPVSYTVYSAGTKTLYAWVKDAAGNVSAAAGATVNVDITKPAITGFAVTPLVNSLAIPVTSFAATDNTAVTGYMISEKYVIPLASASGWLSSAPAEYVATTAGIKRLYAWVKDAAGNVSLARSAISFIDLTKPVVSSFVVPSVVHSFTIPVTSFIVADNLAVKGYLITEEATAPNADGAWSTIKPTTYVASSDGAKTLYAWAKDSVGNVSPAKSASVTIDMTMPVVTEFAVPSAVKSRSVPISSFSATDNVAVAGYRITPSPVRPLAASAGWSSSRPASYTAGVSGIITLYAWVKDSAGNVSNPLASTISIDTTPPVVTIFSVPAKSSTLSVPISAFAAMDNTDVTGYLVTESSAAPPLTASGWSSLAPTSFTVSAPGAKRLYAWAKDEVGNVSLARSSLCTVYANTDARFTMSQTLSDQAQRTTLAFSALAMMTGNLGAQSFFPPGKVADYTGFQYLRDNDPDGMGHNTSFLTRIANNVIYILDDDQFEQLKTLAVAQQSKIAEYGYKRFPLMKAFRRLIEGEIPSNSSGLNLNAVKAASRDLYLIDGQISFDRAVLYAAIINSLSPTQKAYLEAMKGRGWNSWPDITTAQVDARMKTLPQGTSVAVMTYAGDLFSWYAGSVEADVYFCPERHGTYFGSFFIKDAPAIGHEGYGINEQLTATAGRALSDSSAGYVTQSQAAVMSSLVEVQRDNLYGSGVANIVSVRGKIAALLRSLLSLNGSTDAIREEVLDLSASYGELDGENNYHYALTIAQVYETLTDSQKDKLTALRKSIMSGTYADGTPFDFSTVSDSYHYSAVIKDTNVLTPYIANTDYLFFEP